MTRLAIRALDATPLRIPLARPVASSLGTYEHLDLVLVTLTTSDGPSGQGLTVGLGGGAAAAIAPYIQRELAPLALGQDALAPEALWQRLWAPNKARMRAGLGVQALSAIDIACWDVVGKAAGLPLWRLLGGYRPAVPAYGSGGWLSLSDVELVAEAQAFAAQGLRAYKFKVGSPRDAERAALLRRELGPGFGLYADANQAYRVAEALEAARALAPAGVGWLEEPVLADTLDDVAAVAAGSPIPVAVGENVYLRWGFRAVCERRAASFLQPDVGRCGGVTEFRKIAHLADAYRLRLSSHLLHEISVSLLAATPAAFQVEYMELIPADALERPIELRNGALVAPEVPGHGVTLTGEALRRFALD